MDGFEQFFLAKLRTFDQQQIIKGCKLEKNVT
jgi:hypothetical protein